MSWRLERHCGFCCFAAGRGQYVIHGAAVEAASALFFFFLSFHFTWVLSIGAFGFWVKAKTRRAKPVGACAIPAYVLSMPTRLCKKAVETGTGTRARGGVASSRSAPFGASAPTVEPWTLPVVAVCAGAKNMLQAQVRHVVFHILPRPGGSVLKFTKRLIIRGSSSSASVTKCLCSRAAPSTWGTSPVRDSVWSRC